MSGLVKLAAFGLTLALVFGAAFATGAAVGPFDEDTADMGHTADMR